MVRFLYVSKILLIVEVFFIIQPSDHMHAHAHMLKWGFPVFTFEFVEKVVYPKASLQFQRTRNQCVLY